VAGRRASEPERAASRRRPATTPEGRENQLIAAAVDLAEDQIRAGTASAQVITHYLKLGSSREKLEQERIRNENALMEAKKIAIAAQENMAQMFSDAMDAFRGYRGEDPSVDYDD
jgi:hypothetical protein